MLDETVSREKLQRKNLKLPVKKQEILFYFTKDHAKIVNSMMSKVSSQDNSIVVEGDEQDSSGDTKEAHYEKEK